MRGKITANLLNVRSKPNLSGKIIGQLQKENIIPILGQTGNWYEVPAHKVEPAFNEVSGFIYGEHVQLIKEVTSPKGIVTANILNVRSKPDISGDKMGTLAADTIIDIVAEHDDWLEIEFNNSTAFVSKNHVKLIDGGAYNKGRINTNSLNVRSQPNLNAGIVGTLKQNFVIEIISKVNNWFEIRFNGNPAYVHSIFIDTDFTDDDAIDEVIPVVRDAHDDLESEQPAKLEPIKKLKVTGTSKQIKVAQTWNKFGGLLDDLCKKQEIETAAAIAVLCVESSGKGFEKNNNNKMIVRFENHKFYKYWGKENPETFKKHFKYQSGKVWLGHKWRKTPQSEWQTFHGNQAKEWQVLDFARKLDDSAALYSISMGAPQIMGFHYKVLKYSNVQQMFEKFSSDIQYHIKGLFGFFDTRMIKALQKLDFETFAGYYNGSGQKEKYGKWIKEHYDAFKSIA